MTPRLASIVLLVTCSSSVSPATATAQEECDPDLFRGPRVVTPSDSARDVTLDAIVEVEFSDGYFDEPGVDPATAVTLGEDDGGAAVPGRTQVIRDTLFFVPDAPLSPSTFYSGRARGLDGDLEFAFETGTVARDTTPPVLGEIDGASSSEVEPSCEAPDGGFRIDVSFRPATDDGPAGSIEYLLFLTRGPMVDAPQLRATARNFATELVTMAFVLSPDEAVAPVCVAVHAVDGLGNVDDDGQSRCFDPVQGNYFEPLCSVTPGLPAASRRGPWLALLLALGLVARRLRR